MDRNRGYAVDKSDLMQAGFIGLLDALDRFDVTRGFNFISYAVHYIRQQIRLAYHNNHPIHIPEHQRARMHQVAAAKDGSDQDLSSTASVDDTLARVTKAHPDFPLNREELIELMQVVNGVFLPGCHGHSNEDPHDSPNLDAIKAPEPHRIGPDAPAAIALLSKLGERRKTLLTLRFGLEPPHKPHTLTEVGVAMGMTRERVRQIEEETLHMLREMLTARGLDADACLVP
jgi:RNA polymerase nonessential primary-like sigma factor